MMVTAQKTQPARNQTRPAGGGGGTPKSRVGAGNRHRATSLDLPGTLQAKLTIGKANDPLEQEADRVASEVMGTSSPNHLHSFNHLPVANSVQRACSCGSKSETASKCTKCRKQQMSLKRRDNSSHESGEIPESV